jgi:hypothetical protein
LTPVSPSISLPMKFYLPHPWGRTSQMQGHCIHVVVLRKATLREAYTELI